MSQAKDSKNIINAIVRSIVPQDDAGALVLPRSKTARLAKQAKSANIEAEKAIAKAYQIELSRTKAVTEAMFKIGKALRYTLESTYRQILLRTESARRSLEPAYRRKE